ncbi:type IX secretion system protein PorQ [Emticicia sp. W12TSBA100-4]|uniref:type IX secretion system protein PorQ n=1 Tax=Emticicia sp. W12TSBA100-4 TaxID=3160965 RepID=UPI00330634C3
MVRSGLGLAILCFRSPTVATVAQLSAAAAAPIGRALLFVFLSISVQTFSQNSFSFLNIANNARVNGLGGINVSLTDNDINLFSFNPALLDSANAGQIGLNFSPYLASSKFLTLNYSPKFLQKSKEGNWAVSLQNLSYGTFQGTDAVGNLTNEFSANDFSLGLTYSRRVNHISFGITSKVVASVLENYGSVAFLTDWGGTFKHPEHDLSIGVVAKNIGYVLKTIGAFRPDVPFDLQLGASFKPKYMPVRFSLTGHHLYVFDIAYNDPAFNFTFDEQGNKIPKKISTADKISRHFILSTEILIHKNFNVLLGYNFLRRKELLINGLGGAAGLSFGANLRLKKLDFSISHSIFTSPKGQTSFTLNWRR